jgi:predicted ATP-grasp superfamily ATP-dependent carboligase
LRLLVYEHVSGGGFADKALSSSVLSEGFGMLRTLIADFKAAGHTITTTLDSRIARLNPPLEADCVLPVSSWKGTQDTLQKIAEQANATHVIAPETDDVLQSLVELVELTGTTSLNCPPGAIEKVSDKVVFLESMKKLGVLTPKTLMFNATADLNEIKKTLRGSLDFPLIFKPSDGVSCCGLSIASNEDQLAGAVNKIKQETASKHFLVQELIEGVAASVSLICTGGDVTAVSLNRQDITLETPESCSSYTGGSVPFNNPLRAEAFEAAEKIVKAFPDLRGYVGVDFVLTEDKAVVVEVNPRLTTSYIGLRRVDSFNPAQAIINAVINRELPKQIDMRGYTCFSKVKTPNPPFSALQMTYSMKEVVSPPFPVSETNGASALIASHGATPEEAEERFREAKKRVLNTISRGK